MLFMANNLSVLNFAAQKLPRFIEERGKEWILFGDEGEYKNRYPDYLLDLFRNSAKHNAIINSKKDYVVGNGWVVDDAGLSTDRLAAIQEFVNNPNQYESLDDILEKVALDFELYNGFALEIVYNQLNEKIAAIYHADFSKYRSNADGSCYYYSDDWSVYNPVVEKIEAFDWKNPTGKQLLYVKAYSPDCKYYPLPTYIGAVSYINLDVEIANFHLNSIQNGFMGGTLINFYNGEPTEEEQEQIEKQIKDKFTNTDNANSIVLNFADSRDRGAEIQQLNGNDFDTRFDILNKTVQKELYAGHQVVDPALFGIKEEGLFSSRTQLVDSFELFKNTYVNNRQQFIERVFNELASLQGFEKRLTISDTEPISVQLSESATISVMTQDEIREKIGLPKLETKTEMCQHFSEDTDRILIKAFSQSGSDEYEVVDGRQFSFENEHTAQIRESEFKKFWFGTLDPLDAQILSILKDNPSASFVQIAESLSISIERMMTAIQILNESNAIKLTIEKVLDETQRIIEVTEKGNQLLTEIKPLDDKLEMRYVYALREGVAGTPVIETTREFCREMLAMSAGNGKPEPADYPSTAGGKRTWSSTEIQNIGFMVDRNVWQRGGGWWGKNFHCRHDWWLVATRKKR